MKKIGLLAIIFVTLSTATITVVLQKNLKDKIIQSFSEGNINNLASHFSDEMYLELFDKEVIDDQKQIIQRLDTFFEQYPPKQFRIRHEGGKSHKNYTYLIGILQTEEEIFRITITIKRERISNIAIIFQPPLG